MGAALLAVGRDGNVAVAFDLEDSGPLAGRLERVRQFYDLGVRTMLPSYNNRNAAGGGCLDEVDEGLTAYGRALAGSAQSADADRVAPVGVGYAFAASPCSLLSRG
ncbi:membrane dipeptidase [Streptomyces sp. SCL15-4]|uniref:membrane dipeptidase n=1 Tax=Streptomyces sp. SCL15-4 TaxID=2967221 RepID=UPI002966B249|nr:membrane dipeptidase [Streptomyces sp. SCL15-4]